MEVNIDFDFRLYVAINALLRQNVFRRESADKLGKNTLFDLCRCRRCVGCAI